MSAKASLLTKAADILALSDEQAASKIPVHLRGVVTAAEPNWKGRFFVQDDTAGVFVVSIGATPPIPGDFVEVTGVSRMGGYAPCIQRSTWRKLGVRPLPFAKPVTVDQLMSGRADSQRVAFSAVVRDVSTSTNRLGLELESGGYRLSAYLPIPRALDPQSLIGATVTVKGTAAAGYNAPLRHFVTVTLFVPDVDDFAINQPADPAPFDRPLTPLNGIAQYRRPHSSGNQVRVKGVVTLQRPGEELFLEDSSGGLEVKTKSAQAFPIGSTVEAVGFPAVENYLPVLEDALVRRAADPIVPVQPRSPTIVELQNGLHHADFVVLRGNVIDRLTKGIPADRPGHATETRLVLQSSNFIFMAEKDTSGENDSLTSIPVGSLVEARGICLLDSGADGKAKSLRLLLPASSDVRVLQRPSWWTPPRLLAALAIALVVGLVAMSWSVMLSKKNSVLRLARAQLQQAHDQLEERVRERTAQLKVEMTTRKESELQFRAVLTERTRLAQELHDTLDQTMTGIALQLELASDLFQKNPNNSSHHLKLARNLMRQGQNDVRQSLWGLRSRANEQFNLVNALIVNSRNVASGAGLKVRVETSGSPSRLSETMEEDLLRISQEAVTNVVKHAQAASLKLTLAYNDQHVVLEIKDDGKGFNPQQCDGPQDGHFGLLGIQERVQRLGGRLTISSATGQGTSLRIEIPVTAPAAAPAPAPHETA